MIVDFGYTSPPVRNYNPLYISKILLLRLYIVTPKPIWLPLSNNSNYLQRSVWDYGLLIQLMLSWKFKMPYTFANPTGQCEACFDWRELSSVTIYMLARLTYSYWGGDYRYCSGAVVGVVHPLLLVAMPCMVCTSECYIRSLCPAHLQSSCSNVETMQ